MIGEGGMVKEGGGKGMRGGNGEGRVWGGEGRRGKGGTLHDKLVKEWLRRVGGKE